MTNTKKKKSSSIPRELIPVGFLIAQIEDNTLWLGFFGLLAVLIAASLILYAYSPHNPCAPCGIPMTGLSVTVNGIFTVLGVDGDAVALVILGYTIWVKTSSEDKYVKTYFKQAKELYNESDEDVTARLQNYFGVLRREATTVLSLELGTVLLALATFLKFIVDIVTGVIG